MAIEDAMVADTTTVAADSLNAMGFSGTTADATRIDADTAIGTKAVMVIETTEAAVIPSEVEGITKVAVG